MTVKLPRKIFGVVGDINFNYKSEGAIGKFRLALTSSETIKEWIEEDSNNVQKLFNAFEFGCELEFEFTVGKWVINEEWRGISLARKIADIVEGRWLKFEGLEKGKYEKTLYREATEEEIKKSLEYQKWEGIGRLHEEYRNGDIVLANGEICEINDLVEGEGFNDQNRFWTSVGKIEKMICPVEQRFDRKKEGGKNE